MTGEELRIQGLIQASRILSLSFPRAPRPPTSDRTRPNRSYQRLRPLQRVSILHGNVKDLKFPSPSISSILENMTIAACLCILLFAFFLLSYPISTESTTTPTSPLASIYSTLNTTHTLNLLPIPTTFLVDPFNLNYLPYNLKKLTEVTDSHLTLLEDEIFLRSLALLHSRYYLTGVFKGKTFGRGKGENAVALNNDERSFISSYCFAPRLFTLRGSLHPRRASA